MRRSKNCVTSGLGVGIRAVHKLHTPRSADESLGGENCPRCITCQKLVDLR